MRHGLGVAEVVQRHDLDVGAERVQRTEEVPTDAPEPVDADTHCHRVESNQGGSDQKV